MQADKARNKKIATDTSYTREIFVSASPEDAYHALTQEVGKWWGAPEGDTISVGGRATFQFGKTHWTMRVKELVPEKKVVWKCVDANHIDEELSASARDEWLGTTLRWDIEKDSGRTRIRFVHEGLTPSLECYRICEAGWDHFFVGNLQKYLGTMAGKIHGKSSTGGTR